LDGVGIGIGMCGMSSIINVICHQSPIIPASMPYVMIRCHCSLPGLELQTPVFLCVRALFKTTFSLEKLRAAKLVAALLR
jgi:hypothetical protein